MYWVVIIKQVTLYAFLYSTYFWWYHNICVVYNIDVFCFSGSPLFLFISYSNRSYTIYLRSALLHCENHFWTMNGYLCWIHWVITHDISFVYILTLLFRFCVYDHTRYIISYCCRLAVCSIAQQTHNHEFLTSCMLSLRATKPSKVLYCMYIIWSNEV